jgi:hypothetical protein
LTDIAGGVAVGLVDAGGTSGGTVVLVANNGPITEHGSDAANDIVGKDVTIDITGTPANNLGTLGNMVEIGAQILRLGNSSGGYVFFDMNGTANNLPGKELPAGLILDYAHLPKLIICGTQIIGGARIDDLNFRLRDLSQFEAYGPVVYTGFLNASPQEQQPYGDKEGQTLLNGVIQ